MHLPVIFMIIGGFVKLAINWFFIPKWGILAAPIATDVCYFLIVGLNLTAVAIIVKIKYDIKGSLIKPIIASGALALAAIGGFAVASPVVGIRLGCLLAIGVAAAVYLGVMFLIKGITKEDLNLRPRS